MNPNYSLNHGCSDLSPSILEWLILYFILKQIIAGPMIKSLTHSTQIKAYPLSSTMY